MMSFKRSLWGYSADQLMLFLNERSMVFQTRRQELESNLETISQSEQELAQLLSRVQIQHDQARQRQQIIESSKPIVDIFLSLGQDYVASQAESVMRNNEALLAELALQTEQINADQNQLQLFWQTLHANLGNLLNAVEVAESAGRSLLSKYASDLKSRTMKSDIDSLGAVQHEPLSANNRFKVAQHVPQTDIDSLETTQLEPLPANDRLKVVQHLPQPDIDSSEATQYEPLTANDRNDRFRVIQHVLQPDIDNSETTQHEPLIANDRFKVVQHVTQPDTDSLGVIGHDCLPDIDRISVTQHEALATNENTIQEKAENKPILADRISNLIEPEPQAVAASLKQKVLIMDDDTTILAMLRIILERDGFSIIEYNDGYQTSQNINRIDPPLLAILENNSPNVSGLELVRMMRTKPEWDHCSIIMLTENANEHEISDLLEAGANNCISKPVNTRELVARVRKLTGNTTVAL